MMWSYLPLLFYSCYYPSLYSRNTELVGSSLNKLCSLLTLLFHHCIFTICHMINVFVYQSVSSWLECKLHDSRDCLVFTTVSPAIWNKRINRIQCEGRGALHRSRATTYPITRGMADDMGIRAERMLHLVTKEGSLHLIASIFSLKQNTSNLACLKSS